VDVAQRLPNAAIHQPNPGGAHQNTKRPPKHDRVMVDYNRDNLERFNQQEETHKAAVDMIESQFTSQKDLIKSTADRRVQHIVDDTEQQKSRLNEHYENVKDAQAKSHREEKFALRQKVEREKNEAVERVKGLIRKQELTHTDKTANLVSKYEAEIARLNDELVRVRRAHDEDQKRLAGELSRSHKTELDSQQLQYQEKLRKVQDQHNDEMRKVAKHNQEREQQLISTMKAQKS
jgi:hypothetical protein